MDGLRHRKEDQVHGLEMPDISLRGMRVTFVSPPFQLPHNFIDYPMFMNLGLLHNAAVVEQLGAEVAVVDAIYSADSLPLERGESWDRLGLLPTDLMEQIVDSSPDVVILHSSFFANPKYLETSYFQDLSDLLHDRLPDCPIVLADMFLGGLNYFDYDPAPVAETLRFDAVLQGETEVILPSTLAQFMSSPHPTEVLFGRGERASGLFPSEPDSFPDPAFHLLDMDRYFEIQAEAQRENLVPEYHAGERLIPYMSSRGCPYACVFCTQQVLDLRWRGYSSDRLIQSINGLRRDYAIDRVLFLDDLMNLDGSRFDVFAKHMAEIGLSWDTVNGFRADRLNERVLLNMKAAGNRKVTVSAESADQRVLDHIVRKGLKISDIEQTAKTAKQIDYPCQIHYVIGFPGERRSEINTTLLHAARMRSQYGAVPLVQYATPVEGTRLFRLLDEGQNWSSAEDRERNVSALFYADSVIQTDEFTPEDLKRMRATFVQAMRDLDSTPTGLSVSHNDHSTGYRSAEDIIAEAKLLPQTRRRVVLTGKRPLLHPDLPELVDGLGAEGIPLVGVHSDPAPLFNGTVRAFLARKAINWIIVDLRPPFEDLKNPIFRRSFSEVTKTLRAQNIHVSLVVDVNPVEGELLDSSFTVWCKQMKISSVEAIVTPPGDSLDPGAPIPVRSDLLSQLADSIGTKLRVHRLPPCVVINDALTSEQDSPYGSQKNDWKLVSTTHGTEWLHGPGRRIEQCSSCIWKVGCGGLP
jgi:magnesium-protoporphyrin IX monomethyl ester (oxidative) cyclase